MPQTPKVQRFLSHILKPLPQVLRKRRRHEYDAAAAPQMQDLPLPRPACVALQNEDREEDAVVITALTVVPFCCHADLLTMDRLELALVAHTLNAKLPRALQIDIRPTRADAYIRNEIERLVGIRTDDDTPETPKPVKSLPAYARAGGTLESPVSPLANRADTSTTNAALDALQEVDEDVAIEPLHKKRRFDPEAFFRESPARPPARAMMRSQSDNVVAARSYARVKPKVLRAQSQRIPKPVLQGIHPNINIARGRTGSRTVLSGRPINVFTTSTPKRRRLMHDSEAAEDSLTAKLPTPGPKAINPAVVAPVHGRHAGVARVLKRKLSELSMDETEVTFGIEGMTIPAMHSRMEVDVDV